MQKVESDFTGVEEKLPERSVTAKEPDVSPIEDAKGYSDEEKKFRERPYLNRHMRRRAAKLARMQK